MLNVAYSLDTLLDGVSLNDEQSTNPLNIKNMIGYSAEFIWSAGSVSRSVTLELRASNTEDGGFTVIDSYTIDGNEGVRLINVEYPRYNWIKVTSSNASAGGGTLTVTIAGRGI